MSTTINNVADLCAHFGVEYPDPRWFQRLNRRIYKSTECGASISVYGDKVYHNGHPEPVPASFALAGFTIQSIVEGSDVEVCSDVFPVGLYTGEQVDAWIADMEAQVDDLWNEANGAAEHDQDEV